MSIRVLVVDDSATMRGLITARLRGDPMIEVVGQASDPHDARQAIKRLNPDVITLDIEMPNMDGIEFLEKIMRLRPTPVIMISTLTQRGADVSLKALGRSAPSIASPNRVPARRMISTRWSRRSRRRPTPGAAFAVRTRRGVEPTDPSRRMTD